MARFLYHTGCPKCHSRDNLGIYDDGSSWCFGCSISSSPTISPYVLEDEEEYLKPLPNDLTTEYSKQALDWTMKYDITPTDLLTRGACFSPGSNQLIFPSPSPRGIALTKEVLSKEKVFACGRLLNPSNKQRYTTYNQRLQPFIYKADVPEGYGIRRGRGRTTLVMVEDCLSAIKVARQVDCMPLLTSTLPTKDLVAVAGLYDAFLIWLDGNMYHKAQKIARKLQMLGKEARAIYTKLDPKEYDNLTIQKIVL